MLNRVLEFSLYNRFLIFFFTSLVIAIGVYSLRRLPIDAVPDVTPNQVQILTNAPGLGPVEVEKFITFPVETAMSGLPGIEKIRSVSRFGLSAVTVYFDEGMDTYFCRRLVMERLPIAEEAIPEGLGSPELGPISTGLGEIYQFEVRGKGLSLMELRSILEWDIAFKLKSVPGVVEVNTYGGELKTYEVQLDANKLVSYGLPIGQVFDALRRNNANSGGAYIVHNQEQYLIRGEGLIRDLRDLENIIVEERNRGIPIYIRDIGRAVFAPMVRQGAVTRDGRGEAVTGVVMMLIGENSRVVVNRVKEKIKKIEKALPPGVTIDPYYDRTELVRTTIRTVTRNLLEGAILVVAVLLLLLGNFRGGLIVASVIPLSMLFAFTGMVAAGVSGNLMSLGAIDFGLIVDGAVLMMENIVRHVSELKAKNGQAGHRIPIEEMRSVVRRAGREVLRPIFFAVCLITIVFLPILSLEGVEGKMFGPMAITLILALSGALILAFTLVPALAVVALRRGVRERETWLVRAIKFLLLRPMQRLAGHPIVTVCASAVLFAASLIVAPYLGAEFIPRLDEGAFALQAWRLPSVSLEESIENTGRIEKVLKRFPEVVTVVSRTGRAEIATDPMGVEISDIYVILKRRDEWQSAKTREELIAKFGQALDEMMPGTRISYSQPIELRVQELIAGVRSDVAVAIFGEDLDELKEIGDRVVRVVSQIPGAADTKAEQIAGLPYLRVIIKRDAIARYGINASEILDTVEAMGGKVVGVVLEGQKRFFLQVRFQPEDRSALDRIGDIRVSDPSGRLIPIKQLADIRIEEGPAQISRENLHRRLAVEANVRGRDLASFVAEARQAVEAAIKLPPGYWVEWGGQFENLQRAAARLSIVVPMALLLIFLFLYMTFNSAKPALLIFLNVPLAATGGIFALALRGMPFSISAGVGFIALFGVAVMNGIVLVSHVISLRREGLSVHDAVNLGIEQKMRAMIMAPAVAALGFLPMAISTSAGAEVQRPLATVVIGGLVSSTFVTLFVLPSIYRWFEGGVKQHESKE